MYVTDIYLVKFTGHGDGLDMGGSQEMANDDYWFRVCIFNN